MNVFLSNKKGGIMESHLCEFEDAFKWLIDKKFIKNTYRSHFKTLYDKIKDPCDRVNTHDKQWIACGQDYEKQAVEDVMEILGSAGKEQVKKAVEKICKRMKSGGINNNPRIPFYLLVLDEV